MPRTRLFPALDAVTLITVLLALCGQPLLPVGDARAEEARPAGSLGEVALPGGLRAALAAIDDRSTPDRSQFLVDFIRRVHQNIAGPSAIAAPNGPGGATNVSVPTDSTLLALVAHLQRAGQQRTASTDPIETLPLPLPLPLWTDVVFEGRVKEHELVAALIQSRQASLFYYGLLSLDDATRAWLAGEPALVKELVTRPVAAFVLAAPGLRIADGRLVVPGGAAADAAWEALVGRRTSEPAAFVRALLTKDDGQLAYFYGAIAGLAPARAGFALGADAADAAVRVASGRRLYALFERLSAGWRIEARTFVRPSFDPALLAADLEGGADGRPSLPGTRRFWQAAFDDGDPPSIDGRALLEGGTVDFGWLCERVFEGDPIDQRRRYLQVLFASRLLPRLEPGTARDALAAVHAYGRYPALVNTLERIGLRDVAVFAQAAHRAARLSAIDDEARGSRALTQFQGLLAIVARAAARGSLPAASLGSLVTSLAAVESNAEGDYEGRLITWVDAHLRPQVATTPIHHDTPGPVEHDLVALLAGPPAAEGPSIEWEGTAYRVDLARAEALRLTRLLGEAPPPFLSSARTLLTLAASLGGGKPSRDDLKRDAAAFAALAESVGWTDDEAWPNAGPIERYRQATAALERAARGAAADVAPLTSALRTLADDLFARGLLELVYATALGQTDRAWFRAGDAASGHDFGLRAGGVRRRDLPWRPALTGGEREGGRERYAVGSLLGLDVQLAQFSLLRLSSKPPPRPPTLHEEHRKVFVESLALLEPRALADSDRQALVAAIRRGRERMAAVRTAAEAATLAAATPLGPVRGGLLAWTAAHDRDRLATALSPTELLWLGLGGEPIPAAWQAWGVASESRLGCLCPRIVDRRLPETFAGRWGTGMLASAFPDLHLRLAELLLDLHMPAPLLAPVLMAATLDFVNGVLSRDQDDRRAMVEQVQALTVERVEQYLALLTTDGPLVPMENASDATATRTGVPR